jgi:hypothetical protein
VVTYKLGLKMLNEVKERDPQAYAVVRPPFIAFWKKKKKMGKEAFGFALLV